MGIDSLQALKPCRTGSMWWVCVCRLVGVGESIEVLENEFHSDFSTHSYFFFFYTFFYFNV